jgi:hypothetical protein
MKWFLEFTTNSILNALIVFGLLSVVFTFLSSCWRQYWKNKTILKFGYPPVPPVNIQVDDKEEEEDQEDMEDMDDWDEEEWKTAYIKKKQEVIVQMQRINDLERELYTYKLLGTIDTKIVEATPVPLQPFEVNVKNK